MRLLLRLIVIMLLTMPTLTSANSLLDYTIAIDPGHGGDDSGTVGFNGATHPNEEDIVLDIALQLREQLERYGATVIMTRSSSDSITGGSGASELNARVKYINQRRPDALLSIHLNGFKDASANGTETYVHSQGTAEDARLAGIIQASVLGVTGTHDRGLKTGAYIILGVSASIPAVLSEVLFLTNKSEFEYIIEETNKTKIASAFASGFDEYFDADRNVLYFDDVNEDQWYFQYVKKLYEQPVNGAYVLDGYPGERKLKPEKEINRAEFAKMLSVSSAKLVVEGNGSDAWYDKYVVALSQYTNSCVTNASQYFSDDNSADLQIAKIVTKYEAGCLVSAVLLKDEELAANDLKKCTGSDSIFSEEEQEATGFESVCKLWSLGIVSGEGDSKKFMGELALNRAVVAKIISLSLQH